MLQQIALLTTQIAELDKQLEKLAKKYPEIEVLRTVPGVGPVVATAYVLTLDRPDAVAGNRAAGAYLGPRPAARLPVGRLRPAAAHHAQRQHLSAFSSGAVAQYILGRFGPDSALRRWGLKLAASGGKRGKKRALVAVARKLAVMLHSMWRSGQRFQAFPQEATVAA